MKLLIIIPAILLLSSCARENVFNEPPGEPVIDSIRPARGGLGTQIRLYGSGFSTSSSFNTITVNGKTVRVDSPSTATVLLATFMQNTGTGPVNVKVNDREGTGPIFTWQDTQLNPVITKVEYGFNDGDGFAVSVRNLPPDNSTLRFYVNGRMITIDEIARAGSDYYDPIQGDRLLFFDGNGFMDNAILNYADVSVEANGHLSNTFRVILKPEIRYIDPSTVISGDQLYITGNYFGDRSFPSKITLYWQGELSPAPTINEWTNERIRFTMPRYPQVTPNGGGAPTGYANVSLEISVGNMQSYWYTIFYKL